MFSFLPRPQVRLQNVTISDSGGALHIQAKALAVRGNLRLLALLAGSIDFDRIELLKPDMVVDLDKVAHKSSAVLAAWGGAAAAAGIEGASPGAVNIHNGNILLKSSSFAHDLQLSEVDFKFDWPQGPGPLAFNGRGSWRQVPFGFSAWLANPAQLLGGGKSAITLTLRSGQSRAAWKGTLMGGENAQFAGDFRLFIPNVGQLPFAGAAEISLPPAAERLAAEGTLVASTREQTLSAARISLLGSDYEGALAARTGAGNIFLSGTLASENLLLTPVLTLGRQIYKALGRSPALPAGFMSWLGLDLRISAGSATARDWRMDDVAMAVRSKDSRLELDLAEARIFGGLAEAHGSLVEKDGALDLSFTGQSSRINLAELCPLLGCGGGVGGASDFWLSATAKGVSQAQIAASISGEGQIDASALTLAGIDFGQALRRIEKRSLSGAFSLRDGQTSFDTARIGFLLSGGVATITQASLKGISAELKLAGTADLARRTMALEALARRPQLDGGAIVNAPVLNFRLEGPGPGPISSPTCGQHRQRLNKFGLPPQGRPQRMQAQFLRKTWPRNGLRPAVHANCRQRQPRPHQRQHQC